MTIVKMTFDAFLKFFLWPDYEVRSLNRFLKSIFRKNVFFPEAVALTDAKWLGGRSNH